jgi:hypothetical protein
MYGSKFVDHSSIDNQIDNNGRQFFNFRGLHLPSSPGRRFTSSAAFWEFEIENRDRIPWCNHLELELAERWHTTSNRSGCGGKLGSVRNPNPIREC